MISSTELCRYLYKWFDFQALLFIKQVGLIPYKTMVLELSDNVEKLESCKRRMSTRQNTFFLWYHNIFFIALLYLLFFFEIRKWMKNVCTFFESKYNYLKIRQTNLLMFLLLFYYICLSVSFTTSRYENVSEIYEHEICQNLSQRNHFYNYEI